MILVYESPIMSWQDCGVPSSLLREETRHQVKNSVRGFADAVVLVKKKRILSVKINRLKC